VALQKYNQGDLESAIEDYNKALDINPQDAEAYYNRGNAKYNQGDLETAIEDYNKAIDINPKYANAYNNRGDAKSKQGDLDSAIEDYNKAIDINPTFPEAFCNIGWCRLHCRDSDDALVQFRKALELGQQFPDALYGAELAQHKLFLHASAYCDFPCSIDNDMIDKLLCEHDGSDGDRTVTESSSIVADDDSKTSSNVAAQSSLLLQRDHRDRTPLHVACMRGSIGFVRAAVKAACTSSNVSAPADADDTASRSLLSTLLTMTDCDGRNCLHLAAKGGNVDVFKHSRNSCKRMQHHSIRNAGHG
jgi:TPR repeat/Tetratricopeptide repeat